MGTDLYLEKGKHSIFFGRAYRYESAEAELLEKICKQRARIILCCANSNMDNGDINEQFDELVELAGLLEMKRFINMLKEEGYKEVLDA